MDDTVLDSWLQYAEASWNSAGRPIGLKPDFAIRKPAEFDCAYYRYFERRYIDIWLEIYSRINPENGYLLKRENPAFKESWNRNFSWSTIWKQVLPLLVYGSVLGASNKILVEIASFYCMGQAIPSIVIDRILDERTEQKFDADAAFCILAYTKSLKFFRAMNLPRKDILEDIFVRLTSEMYDRMITEHHLRFKTIPQFPADAITDYLSPQSRLRSSVFFGVLPTWAYVLANKTPPPQIEESTLALRIVRQLNDEILDVHEDIRGGLLTLPWIYALEEKPKLRQAITNLWENPNNLNLFSDCIRILNESSGKKRASAKSLEFLSQSMKITMDCFTSDNAFDITLLHNARWALLNWLSLVDYERSPETIQEPLLPKDIILDSASPLEPVPGGGVLVTNGKNKVLMSLVLKRGMLRWELPAGSAKNDECLEETARREALEETGKEIEIGEVVAICWHYSRILNKGWMGMIFRGLLADPEEANCFLVVSPKAFTHGKFNIHITPELYYQVKPENYDFEELKRLCENHIVHSTAFESIVASGFIDWRKIPPERIHPLHRQLLVSYGHKKQRLETLISDADQDFYKYDASSKIYYQ